MQQLIETYTRIIMKEIGNLIAPLSFERDRIRLKAATANQLVIDLEEHLHQQHPMRVGMLEQALSFSASAVEEHIKHACLSISNTQHIDAKCEIDMLARQGMSYECATCVVFFTAEVLVRICPNVYSKVQDYDRSFRQRERPPMKFLVEEGALYACEFRN